MVDHLVLFKFNDRLTAPKQTELLGKLHGLKRAVPGIVELTAGINVTEETDNIKGYTLALRVTFESIDALRNYGPHPAHQDFVRALDGVVEDVIVADYPVDGRME